MSERRRLIKYVQYLRPNWYTLQQLINLLVRHLLAELRQDVSKLARTNEPVALFIKDLETTDELF